MPEYRDDDDEEEEEEDTPYEKMKLTIGEDVELDIDEDDKEETDNLVKVEDTEDEDEVDIVKDEDEIDEDDNMDIDEIDKEEEADYRHIASQQVVNFVIRNEKTQRMELFTVNQKLSGSIDLQGLASLMTLKKIDFHVAGQITKLENIPLLSPVEEIRCVHQHLEKFPLPLPVKSLRMLDLQDNRLRQLPVSALQELIALQILNLSKNELTSLPRILPAAMEEFYVNHNRLDLIDVSSLPRLRIFHAEDNDLVNVIGLVDKIATTESNTLNNTTGKTAKPTTMTTLTDLRIEEGNPRLHLDALLPFSLLHKKKKIAKEEHVFAEYLAGLREYFALKDVYDKKDRRRRALIAQKSRERGIHNMSQILHDFKGKCVRCGRRVTTVFEMRDRRFRVQCGDLEDPCDLHIELYRGDYIPFDAMYTDLYHHIRQQKEQIIRMKMDTLFNYVGEKQTATQFKKTAEEFRVSQVEWQEMSAMAPVEIHFGQEHAEMVRGQRTVVEDIRDKMRISSLTDMPSMAKIYCREYLVEMERLRQMRFPISEIVTEKNADRYIQNYVDLSKLDFLVDEEPRRITATK
jgi:hypothetical protein